jgi:hypothetical protein
MKNGTKVRRLNNQENFTVRLWMMQNRETLSLLDRQQAAEKAREELKIDDLNYRHITTINKDLKIPFTIHRTHKVGEAYAVRAVGRNRVATLSGYVISLYVQLGMPVDETLKAIQNNRPFPNDT